MGLTYGTNLSNSAGIGWSLQLSKHFTSFARWLRVFNLTGVLLSFLMTILPVFILFNFPCLFEKHREKKKLPFFYLKVQYSAPTLVLMQINDILSCTSNRMYIHVNDRPTMTIRHDSKQYTSRSHIIQVYPNRTYNLRTYKYSIQFNISKTQAYLNSFNLSGQLSKMTSGLYSSHVLNIASTYVGAPVRTHYSQKDHSVYQAWEPMFLL